MEELKIDKDKMKGEQGKAITQGLFLELQYSPTSMYSLKEEDCEFRGKKFPSIKRLYLEEEDPTEYIFANKYFLNWKHWDRICANRLIWKYIDEWRKELDLRLKSKGVRVLINQATHPSKNSFAAAKWLVDAGYDIRRKGRPSKKEIEHDENIQGKIIEEYTDDLARLKLVK
jgi:hypothetical protein